MEVKKTQTKAFSNLIASLVLIAFEVWAWLQTNNIKTKSETMNLFRDKGFLAALVVILLCVGYVYLFKSLGYVVVSFLLCAIIMWMIGLRSPVKLILISLLVPLGMWLIFYKMLQVNIPMGWLQFLRDLVDKINF